jgi:hypothetical protein
MVNNITHNSLHTKTIKTKKGQAWNSVTIDNKGFSLIIVEKLWIPLTNNKKKKILNYVYNNKKKEKNHIKSLSFVTSRKKRLKENK